MRCATFERGFRDFRGVGYRMDILREKAMEALFR